MKQQGFADQVLGLIGWLSAGYVAAAIGGFASAQAGSFYGQLSLPGWAPPGWLFGPVWGLLYTLMGLSAWLVWRERGWRDAPLAHALYLTQLCANALWTWLFFAWRQGALAFAEIIVLWALILATAIAFWRVKPLAGALLVPYLLWVSFASVLAFVIWQLNPGYLG